MERLFTFKMQDSIVSIDWQKDKGFTVSSALSETDSDPIVIKNIYSEEKAMQYARILMDKELNS